jgi:hypothetical protein
MLTNAAGLVYGTILVATLLSAESAARETYIRTVLAVLVTLAGYWLTLAYARFTGDRLEHKGHFSFSDLVDAAREELTVLLGAAIPLDVLLVFWLGGTSLDTAVTAAVYTAAITLVVIEVVIGVRADLKGRQLVLQSAVGAALGLMIIGIRVLLH